MNKYLLILVALLVIGIGSYFVLSDNKNPSSPTNQPSSTSTKEFDFAKPTKTPHYVSNMPEHSAILPAQPVNVALEFNFDLSPKSTISVTKDGKEYATGILAIDPNNLVMRRQLTDQMPDGAYTVKYSACWPDNSCHNGQYQFAIDSNTATSYTDMRNQPKVQIDLRDTAFSAPYIIVSPNTEITWVNFDPHEHSINTDPHAGHYYYSNQNSRLLQQNDKYSITLSKPGYYPYHCSPHASVMKGGVIVAT